MSAPPIGFVLLTHADPAQTLRLVDALDAVYGGPPIVCHHDFSKCALDERAFGGRVEFVRPFVRTRWADFSLVEATVRAVAALYARPDAPDWVVLLSGADYPVRPAAEVVRELEAGGADAYVDHRRVGPELFDRREWDPPGSGGYRPGEGPHNGPVSVRRYYALNLRVPLVRLAGGRLQYHPRHLRAYRRGWSERWTPFRDGFACYVGSQWFTLGRRAAEYLVAWHAERPSLRRHYRWAAIPDESYVQTVLGNAPGLRLDPDPRRYVDWPAVGAKHPRTLTLEDLPALERSGAHFARKVDPARSAGLLRALDGRLAGAALR